MIEPILTGIDQYLPPVIKVGLDKGKYKSAYMPLIINYRPIMRYIGSTCQYAFVDVVTKGIIFRPRNAANISVTNPPRWNGLAETIQTIYDEYAAAPELKDFCTALSTTISTEGYQYDTPEDCGMVFCGLIPEIGAIHLKTKLFAAMEDIITSKKVASVNVRGITLPTTITQAGGNTVSTLDALEYWYNSYMACANLELGNFYWKSTHWNFMRNSSKDPLMTRMKLFDEFVPLMIKLDGIFNPFVDLKIMGMLAEKFDIFRKAYKTEGLCTFAGYYTSSMGNDQYVPTSCAYFTTRGQLSYMLQHNFAPQNPNRDVSDDQFNYLAVMTMIYTSAFQALNLPYRCMPFGQAAVYGVTVEDSVEVAEITHHPLHHLSRITVQSVPISGDQYPVWLYMLAVDPKSDLQYYATNLGRYSQVLRDAFNPAVLMNDVGGEDLGKSQNLTGFHSQAEI